MTTRAIHRLGKKTDCNQCGYQTDAWQSDLGNTNTNRNVFKGRTSTSCLFNTPGGTNYQFTDYYQTGTTTPNNSAFMTNPLSPVATDLIVNPADLAKAAVFYFVSFRTTDINGNIAQHLSAPTMVSVEQPGAGTTLPNKITDVALPLINGSFMFGSWDQVLMKMFVKATIPFNVLTDPNEMAIGNANRVQIVWPEGWEWELSFVGPEVEPSIAGSSRLYTYSSSPSELSYILVDQSLNVVSSNRVILGSTFCSTFAVFSEPIGYVTSRQKFDASFPPNPPPYYNGISGVTGATGENAYLQICATEFKINNSTVPINTSCLCIGLTGESGGTGPVGTRVDGERIVGVLNALFNQTSVPWTALTDPFYTYLRIIHPDNVLSFSITLKKIFYKPDGTRNSVFDELQIYRQGSLSTFVKNSPTNGAPVYTTNATDIQNGLSWTSNSDGNGCIKPDFITIV